MLHILGNTSQQLYTLVQCSLALPDHYLQAGMFVQGAYAESRQ